MYASSLKNKLAEHASDVDAVFLQRFFKTGAGEYGEGDVFIGVRMPVLRAICREFESLPLSELNKLVQSPIHEHRMAAVVIASNQYKKSKNERDRQSIFDFYIKALGRGNINNWDLIDVSCEHIVGAHLFNKDNSTLYVLAKSSSLWDRRVSIISTFYDIKRGESAHTLAIAEILIDDTEDLIHKASGWMLREVGKRIDEKILTNFLNNYATDMPRTMLRYAIERLPEKTRQYYMQIRS